MAEGRHTLMREDASLVNAGHYGTATTTATLLVALADIGTDWCTLMLPAWEDGLWTLTGDLVIPVNVTLMIPAGVTLVGTGNLTVLGGLQALRTDWFQSTGTLVLTVGTGLSVFNGVHATDVTTDVLTTTTLQLDAARVRQSLTLGAGVGAPPVVTDTVALWEADRGGVAGRGALRLRTEDGTPYVFGDYFGVGVDPPIYPLHMVLPRTPGPGPGGSNSALLTMSIAPTGPSSEELYGLVAQIDLSQGTYTLTGPRTLIAVQASHVIRGSGALTQVVSLRAIMNNMSSAAIGQYTAYLAEAPILGSGTVTAHYGFSMMNPPAAVPTVVAFGSAVSAGTNRWHLYCAGNAPSYLGGILGVATVPVTGNAMTVQGHLVCTQGNIAAKKGSLIVEEDGTLNRLGLYTTIMAGSGNYGVYCAGTARSQFNGNVGIGIVPSANALEVNGLTYLRASVSVGTGIWINDQNAVGSIALRSNVTNTDANAWTMYHGGSAPSFFQAGLSIGTWDRAYAVRINGALCVDQGVLFNGNVQVQNIALFYQPVGFGIAVDTNYTIKVWGAAGKNGGGMWVDYSDISMKENIVPLEDALGVFVALRPVTFEWKAPDRRAYHPGPQYGLIANEVEAVIPQWVSTATSGLKMLDVRGLEALVARAFQQVLARLEALETQASAA